MKMKMMNKDKWSKEMTTPKTEWEINADIDSEARRQAIKDIENGVLTVRQAARHLGILAEKIVKK